MDSNYRPKSDSSDSRRRRSQDEGRGDQAGRSGSARSGSDRGDRSSGSARSNTRSSRSSQSEGSRSSRSSRQDEAPSRRSQPDAPRRRQTVEYEQTAKTDMQKQELRRDRRLRSARRIRETDSVRVLDDSADSQAGRSGRDKAVTGKSVRVSRERQQDTNAPRALRRNRILAGLIGALVLAVVGLVIYLSPAFLITSVEVNGAEVLSADYLTGLARVPSDATLLRVDVEAITERLAADPWVASAKVTRQFPSTITLEVVERRPIAIVVTPGASLSSERGLWLIASDGCWLGDQAEMEGLALSVAQLQLVRIEKVATNVVPQVGAMISDPGLLNAVAILNEVSPSMLSRIVWIDAPSMQGTTLYLNNNIEVAFGAAEDIAIKEVVIDQLIAEHSPGLLYINVRVADRPTIRKAE